MLWDALKERWVGAIIALDDTTGGCGWIRTGIYGCYSWSRWQQTTRDGRRTRQFQGEIGPSLVRNHGQCSCFKAGVKAVLASRPPGGSLAISRWPPITTLLPHYLPSPLVGRSQQHSDGQSRKQANIRTDRNQIPGRPGWTRLGAGQRSRNPPVPLTLLIVRPLLQSHLKLLLRLASSFRCVPPHPYPVPRLVFAKNFYCLGPYWRQYSESIGVVEKCWSQLESNHHSLNDQLLGRGKGGKERVGDRLALIISIGVSDRLLISLMAPWYDNWASMVDTYQYFTGRISRLSILGFGANMYWPRSVKAPFVINISPL